MRINKIKIIEKGLEIRTLGNGSKEYSAYYKFLERGDNELDTPRYETLENCNGGYPHSLATSYRDKLWTKNISNLKDALDKTIASHIDYRERSYAIEVDTSIKEEIIILD